MANAAAARRMAPVSVRRPVSAENSSAAKTMRFFVHCEGRRERTRDAGTERPAPRVRSVAARASVKVSGIGCRAILSAAGYSKRSVEALDRFRLVLVGLEDRQQLRDR